jgi:hypothetical protein
MSAGVVILLCNLTLNMAQPWLDAGYDVVLVDPQHPESSSDGRIERISGTVLQAARRLGEILRTRRVVFVFGFPPCTDVAVSGSLHFRRKYDADPHFQAKAALVAEQCRMVGEMAGCPWGFENPVSVFSSIFGPANWSFHPWHFTRIEPADNYTKNTQIWGGGGIVYPQRRLLQEVAEAIAVVIETCGRMVAKPKALEATGNNPLVRQWYPDDRIHKAAPGPERANFRSATPRGFAQAMYEANKPREAA